MFGAGLIVSQMIDPNKVLGFLDVTGDWDPSLALVMAAALLVYGSGYWLVIKKLDGPVVESDFNHPQKKLVDKKLLLGASLFGLGWGLTGICPGPALTNVTTGSIELFGFLFTMLVGMQLSKSIKSA